MDVQTAQARRALLAKFKTPQDLFLDVSEIPATVKRPPVAAWVAAGEVPDFLFREATATKDGKPDPAAVERALKEMPNLYAFALKMARASFVWPKLTEEGQEPKDADELDPATLPLPDLTKFLYWAMGTIGRIQTTGGEVAADAAVAFRQDAAVSSDSAGVSNVRAESGGGVGDS